ncbi:hypothetical protein DERF_016735 [Dermatophagoides farinae]|uniref:Uncharacterized protein n=1 Tax=Dermatophagoides farinae TaxID=6954 RepID=A0A922HF05_DERFA|nr:hypothetical protein DERF_016735 [Dermatophagoides farinae]
MLAKIKTFPDLVTFIDDLYENALRYDYNKLRKDNFIKKFEQSKNFSTAAISFNQDFKSHDLFAKKRRITQRKYQALPTTTLCYQFVKLVAERSKFYKFCARHNESFAFNNVIKYNGSNIKSWISTVRAAFLTCGKSHFLENEIQSDNEEYYDYQLLINFRKHARFSHRHSRSK